MRLKISSIMSLEICPQSRIKRNNPLPSLEDGQPEIICLLSVIGCGFAFKN